MRTSTQAAAPAAPSSPRRSRLRRWLSGFLILLLVVGGAYAGLLWWMTGQLQLAVENWAGRQRLQGMQVDYGPPERGGWPGWAALRLPGLRLARDGVSWQAESVRLSLRPWQPDRLRVEAEGAQQIALKGPPMPLRSTALRADLTLNGTAAPLAGALNGTGLRLGSPSGPIMLDSLQASFDASGATSTAFTARLRGLAVPGAQALGERMEEATAQAVLHGSLGDIGPLTRQLAAWRNAGGRLEVQGMTLRWGAMAASAAATLALDDSLQPSGAGTLRLANPSHTLDALAGAGLVQPRAAGMARQILPLLTRLDAGSSVPVIELPLVLEKQALSAARIPLLRLPPVAWP
ncbi:DUF2125 domain-containing protein [Teichococcus wenyumeiae]|uniref:DUF2125 domain-containing protein n=1 Tax=Teichococcus wenyumeiae TaxID=2478470 RepID=UPI0013145102|nr:DUF2125 domain-containing protein [Pseudoroseomonas wenyumeiae]